MGKKTLTDLELLVLLAILRLGEGAYGVPIAREIRRTAGRDVGRATAYVTLQRLERQGIVTSWLGDSSPERGGKARRMYRLEPAGIERVRESREAFRRMWNGLDPILEPGR